MPRKCLYEKRKSGPSDEDSLFVLSFYAALASNDALDSPLSQEFGEVRVAEGKAHQKDVHAN